MSCILLLSRENSVVIWKTLPRFVSCSYFLYCFRVFPNRSADWKSTLFTAANQILPQSSCHCWTLKLLLVLLPSAVVALSHLLDPTPVLIRASRPMGPPRELVKDPGPASHPSGSSAAAMFSTPLSWLIISLSWLKSNDVIGLGVASERGENLIKMFWH